MGQFEPDFRNCSVDLHRMNQVLHLQSQIQSNRLRKRLLLNQSHVLFYYSRTHKGKLSNFWLLHYSDRHTLYASDTTELNTEKS